MIFDKIIDQEIIGNSDDLIQELTPLEKVDFVRYLWKIKGQGFDGVEDCFSKVIELI